VNKLFLLIVPTLPFWQKASERLSLSTNWRKGVVLQLSDAAYSIRFKDFMSTIKYFANQQEFEYVHETIPADGCVYTRKVLAIEKTLLHMPPNQFLWYFDSDVAFAGSTKSTDVLSDILDSANASEELCHFVAQGSKEQINTGCFLIKNSRFGRTLMTLWRDKQMRHKPCRVHTSADQVTLQDAVLEIGIPSYHQYRESCLNFCGYSNCLNDCASNGCTPPTGAPWDWSQGIPNTRKSNECYGRWMSSFGQWDPSPICLLPGSIRFNVHDLQPNRKGYWYREGDIFFVPHSFFFWWKKSTRDVISRNLKLVAQGQYISKLV